MFLLPGMKEWHLKNTIVSVTEYDLNYKKYFQTWDQTKMHYAKRFSYIKLYRKHIFSWKCRYKILCFGNAGCRLQEFWDVLLTCFENYIFMLRRHVHHKEHLYCWLSFNITLASSKIDDKWYKYRSHYLSICIKLSHWFTQTLTWHTLILFPFPCNLNANKNYKPLKHQHGNNKVVQQTIHLLVMLSTDNNLRVLAVPIWVV